jgi:signal transduction histidine kinase
MIAENIDRLEEEMELMRRSHKMGRLMNYVLVGAMVLLILAIILLHRNILIRRKFSKRLIAKNEELRAAYKHVAAADEMKTEFIRNVSHEIRTPLNIINGFTQVLADQGSDMGDTERKAISNTIGNSTRQITSLVNKMLALANDSTKDLLSEVDMTDGLEICQKAIADMPDVDPNRIKVSLDDQTGGDKMLYTHGDSLLQMLGNILENSVKFTEEGHIILKVRTEKQKGRKMMLFSVEDTGCGIPSDKVGTIFQRWVKVDEFTEGLGLGLAYCWESAQKLGGSLKLDQTSEAGTTFTLSLPVEKTND